MIRRNMRREFITDEELSSKIRQEGVDDIALVKRMYLEGDGEISLIKHETRETQKSCLECGAIPPTWLRRNPTLQFLAHFIGHDKSKPDAH